MSQGENGELKTSKRNVIYAEVREVIRWIMRTFKREDVSLVMVLIKLFVSSQYEKYSMFIAPFKAVFMIYTEHFQRVGH